MSSAVLRISALRIMTIAATLDPATWSGVAPGAVYDETSPSPVAQADRAMTAANTSERCRRRIGKLLDSTRVEDSGAGVPPLQYVGGARGGVRWHIHLPS